MTDAAKVPPPGVRRGREEDVGRVVTFPRSRTGFAKIVAFEHGYTGTSRSRGDGLTEFKYILREYDPTTGSNVEFGSDYRVGHELDDLLYKMDAAIPEVFENGSNKEDV